MTAIDLAFAVHNHQPVGNFDHVIEDAHCRAYRPFLEVLEAHPGVCIALHQSGILWEWQAAHHPEHLDTVARLVAGGQIELLGGAYYEPLLPAIPEADRQGQLARMSRFLSERFGVEPRGAWLAERVWEPQLAGTLARAGLDFTIVDDAHFEAAGVPPWELDGSFVTEDEGRPLRVFAIQRWLRERVPFAPPEATLDELASRASAARHGIPLLVYADDGEKFGAWTGTHSLCYGERWLDRFFSLVEANATWLRLRPFAACVDETAPRARVYLPEAAYTEMMEWALPPAAQRRLRRARARLDGEAEGVPGALLRGGTWRGFLGRYPESNWLHKRVVAASRAVQAAEAADDGDAGRLEAARQAVWRAQCNCAYWHGLFGGLYAPHLRSALYAELIAAENHLVPGAAAEPAVADVDADGQPEVVLRSGDLLAIVKPDEGGAIFELDARAARFNLIDMVARRAEAYHEAARATLSPGSPGAAELIYDPYRRGSCIDHWLAPQACWEDFAAAALPELGALAAQPYGWTVEGGGVRLERALVLRVPGDPLVRVVKRLQLRGATLVADYTLRNESGQPLELRFGIEMGINFLAAEAADRWFELPDRVLADRRLGSAGRLDAVRRFDAVDGWRGLRATFTCAPAMELWRVPIATVSMAQHGLEQVYQGTALLFVNDVALPPRGAAELQLRLEVGGIA